MFRRETVHSHFFVHFSPFPVFSAPHRVVCTLHRRFFRAPGARCGGVFSPLCRAVRSPAASPCAFRFVAKGEVRHRRELACGVWKGGCPSFFVSPRVAQKAVPPGWKCWAKCSGRPGTKTWKSQTRKASYSAISPIIRIAGENKCRNAAFRCYYSLTLQS